ncbi:MAG: alpha/beta hydrolase [Chloroflexi bacterium]|nr:alpha/beta hydrolase [Chloroflexota bacterium]
MALSIHQQSIDVYGKLKMWVDPLQSMLEIDAMTSWQYAFVRTMVLGFGLFIRVIPFQSPQALRTLDTISRTFEPIKVLPRGVTSKSDLIAEVPCEWIEPDNADTQRVMLYLHGGGFMAGWNPLHRYIVARLAKHAALTAVAVDYRTTPDHPYPAPLDDCFAVYTLLLDQGYDPQHIAIAGDSAGGNLVFALMHRLKQVALPLPACGVGLSPMVDLDIKREALPAIADPMLSEGVLLATADHYCGAHDRRSPFISPVYGNMQNFPPIMLCIAEYELLRPSIKQFAQSAAAAGVSVTTIEGKGLWHVWPGFAPYLPEAEQTLIKVAQFIKVATDATEQAIIRRS